MKLVLLPGLDGTGKLFKPLIEVLPNSIETQVISYPLNEKLSYDELIEYVKQKLPKEDFILLAESFSGPIAYKLALSDISNLKTLILVATFLENPRPFLLNFIPNEKIFSLPIPRMISRVFLLGFTVKDEILNLFNEAIKDVSPSVIKYRLKEVSKLKPSCQKIKLKTFYIQASEDKLVPSKSLEVWQKVCDDIDVININSEHLILQAYPKRCSEVITKIIH